MTQNSNGYSAHDHLVKIRSKDGAMKDYYPANWRLYEARLRFPDIVLESEILHLDPEHNFVIVKAMVFVGVDYASATLKCSAMKQGLLSALDKVETAAKARALRDLGISTELALESDDSDADDTPTMPVKRSSGHQQNGTSLLPLSRQPVRQPYHNRKLRQLNVSSWTPNNVALLPTWKSG